MLDIILAGGWLMLPIVVSSIVALGIIFERFYALQEKRVIPASTAEQAEQWALDKQIDEEKLITLQQDSPLGRILAAGLANSDCSREVMKDAIEEVGRVEAHNLGRYLNALGTTAAITPLLGLLGTVVGMISVFTTITTAGVGNPTTLAGGISQALMTTAAGLTVAIPALVFSRYFQRRVTDL
ncbi:MAG: MotA/TolQ/ExbB proton channel family protein, partial [Granulosicoccaceae bacterium]